MPKTTKRTETKRAAKVAKAHATELPELEVKEPKNIRRSPGYKSPAHGIARYPWLTTIMLALIILLAGFTLYTYHLGPFAQPKPQQKTQAQKTSQANAASPCLRSGTLKQITNTAPGPTDAQFAAINHTYQSAPATIINSARTYCAGINTNRGLIVVELDPKDAPQTVNNFVFLAQHHFYDGTLWHRVIQTGNSIHIIQSGDPLGNDPKKRGTGGPGYKFNDEPVKGDYTAGSIAMANSGANTNGSQFFISTSDNTGKLAKSYNLFGHVVQGLDVAQKIQGPNEQNTNVKPDIINYLMVVPG